MNDGAIAKVHRDDLVPPTDPDQLPVDRSVFSEWSIDKRLRAVATLEGYDDAPCFVAQRARFVIVTEHFVEVDISLSRVARATTVTDSDHPFPDLGLSGRINNGHKNRRACFNASEMDVWLFAQ
ncbi:MAG: hypothetical protein KatS3mg116_1999 [Elioraea sp.]|nr:MAG: hypothetical protein KatS3mg116_1999 [Elioraea sp.]